MRPQRLVNHGATSKSKRSAASDTRSASSFVAESSYCGISIRERIERLIRQDDLVDGKLAADLAQRVENHFSRELQPFQTLICDGLLDLQRKGEELFIVHEFSQFSRYPR